MRSLSKHICTLNEHYDVGLTTNERRNPYRAEKRFQSALQTDKKTEMELMSGE
jgi:hypothetical protein